MTYFNNSDIVLNNFNIANKKLTMFFLELNLYTNNKSNFRFKSFKTGSALITTLRSIALNYIERKGPRPPKALVHSINQLKKRSDIVISKPDKGSGVVVMDKSDYVRLLSEASINDATKFKPVDSERPRRRGRPPKHYHPLLEKEKHLDSVVRRILPKHIAELLCPKGTRLAHLYGLPKCFNSQCFPVTVCFLF